MFLLLTTLACAPETVEAEAGFVANGCGPVAAFQADRKWSWASVEGAETETEWSSEVRRLRGVSVKVWTVGSMTGPQIKEDYSRTTEYECEAGTWLLSDEMQSAGLNAGEPTSSSTRVAYDEPVFVWPSDLANGDSWQSHYVGVSTTGGAATAFDYTVDYVVKAPADIEVEGGEFHAFQVIATRDSGAESRFWVARESGVVKGQDYELTALW